MRTPNKPPRALPAAAPAPQTTLIEERIRVAFANCFWWVENPDSIMGLPEPAWARLERMRNLYKKFKVKMDSWSKVPTKQRIKIEAQCKRDINKMARKGYPEGNGIHVMRDAAAKMQILAAEMEAEIADMARRLTGKAVVRVADLEHLLATRCGWSRADVESNQEREKVAASLFALLPADVAPPAQGDGKPGNFTPKDPDLLILKALAERRTRCKAESLGVTGVGERTKKTRLPVLETVGLVDRGSGKRSGWAITDKGRTLLAPNAHATRT